MTIDYANRANRPHTSPKRRWLRFIMTITIVVLASILALFYIHAVYMPHVHNKQSSHTQSTPQPNLVKHSPQLPQKQFDFYAMLPKMHVSIKKTKPNTIQLAPHQPYFLLQVAVSSDKRAAQQLVTKLNVMGLNATLKTINMSTGDHYQIVVGPYALANNAVTDQAYLRTNHINSLLLKLKN